MDSTHDCSINAIYSGKSSPSYVIYSLETGNTICEIFSQSLLERLNTNKYRAVPILEHLQSLNKKAQS